MKLIKQSVELIPQKELFKHIERCARVCYKSEDKQSEHSREFVNKLIANKHLAMLEHGTVYLSLPDCVKGNDIAENYYNDCYSKVFRIHYDNKICNIITTNFRVLYEHNWLDNLNYKCEPTSFHEKRYTFRIVTSIGIVRELLRHRKFSFANESTRYCNYSKNKFDNELTFIKPYWFKEDGSITDAMFTTNCIDCEDLYITLIESKLSPQQAREVLPLCTKSELVMTGFESDWKEFLDKRLYETTGKVHPDMKELAQMIETKLFDNKK